MQVFIEALRRDRARMVSLIDLTEILNAIPTSRWTDRIGEGFPRPFSDTLSSWKSTDPQSALRPPTIGHLQPLLSQHGRDRGHAASCCVCVGELDHDRGRTKKFGLGFSFEAREMPPWRAERHGLCQKSYVKHDRADPLPQPSRRRAAVPPSRAQSV